MWRAVLEARQGTFPLGWSVSRYAVVTTKHPASHASNLRSLLSCETGPLAGIEEQAARRGWRARQEI
jgi:hypothetical protein